MALEDSEQKHALLHSVFTDLEDLSTIFETDDLAQSIQELSHQIAALQQRIIESLPQIQRMADDVVAIETEVKSMEKRVSKIKAILLSKEIFDFSPEEHLKHGEVILENIRPMKKTIAEIVSYQVELRLPQTGMKPLPVFQRTNQLLQDIKLLENMTQEQNELLKIVIKQTNECNEEIEKLKQILNNYPAEFSHEHMSTDQAANLSQVQGEIESMEKQILSLNQKKEDLLADLKAAILNLHQHLQQKQQELEQEVLSVGASEESAGAEKDASEWKLNRTGSMSFLPALEEEAEESSLKSEEAAGKISTCDSSMAQVLEPDLLNIEQGPEFSLSPNQTPEGATPPIKAAATDLSDEQGAFEATVEKVRPEPAEVLHVCKNQVAELELWLQQANVAFEPETLDADMQQVVEQQLVGCQAMLTEIEQKVASLLESCRDQGLGDSGDTQQEAEALSLKLKTVKCNLEKVQMMLQEKYSEDQHSTTLKKSSEHQKVLQPDNLSEFESVVTERPQFSRQKDFQQQQVLELKPMEQKDLIKFIEFNANKTWPQYCQHDKDTTQTSSASSKTSSPKNDAPDLILSTQGQSGDKWQYLHHELSSKIRLPPSQLVQPQITTNMSVLPSVGMYNFRYPATEELKTYTTQLEDLRQEANNLQAQENMSEETYTNLDKKLFELFQALIQCLGSVEEMLQTPGLFRGDVGTQQVHYEVRSIHRARVLAVTTGSPLTLALELKKLYLAMSDKKNDLSKAMTRPGKNASQFLDCFENLQVYLEHTQATAASRSKALKAGLDYTRSYQNEIKRLYDQLVKNKTSLQQSLNEISGQTIDEQLQKVDVYTVELQNSESRVAKLRDEGERLHLPYVLLQEVYKLEDVLDSTWGILRARYTELSSPFITESQQDALLQGMVELVNVGKEKLAHDHLQQTKSKVALQAQIQNHKKLVADMLLIQTYSNKMLPSLMQKKETFGAEQVKEVKLLEEKSHQYGIKLQSLLQQTLNYWKEQSLNVSQDLDTIRSNINNFFTAVLSTGNQLLHLKEADTATLRASLAQFEQKWTVLITQLPDIQEKLHQLQMEKLPSRKAIMEMIDWMNNVEHQTEDEDSEHSLSSASQVKNLLQKYKEFRMEMDYKQWIVDFVNQSLLQLSTCDVESKRYERTEFAEHLGEMNRQWQRVHGALNGEVNELKTSTQSVLQEWKIYDKLYEEVNMMTIRFWYCMEHSKPVVLSLEALRCQVQNLQTLQDEAESSEVSWKKLQEVIGKLKEYCPSVAEIIQEKCQNTHTRWTQVNQDIADQLQRAQSLLQLWKAYNSTHAEAATRLEQQEIKYQQLANINTSGNNLAEILPPALHDAKELQCDVQKTKEAFLQNSTLLDRLPQPAESNTHVLLYGQMHSLQRASYLEKMLLVKTNEFEFVLSQFKDFGDRLESLKGLITHEEENLDKLYRQEKEGNPDLFLSPDIEHLNEVSLKLPLSDVAVKTLQNVNRQWIRATATALERCSELQGIGLNEEFLHCCEKWVQLLEKIEETLKANVADSLPALLEQQKTYEMLEAEVSINQIIADSYVTQCLHLLDTAEIEKRPEFVWKFTRLKAQWQSAAQGVRQRKGNIDELVRQWRSFTTSEGDLLRFLADTSHLLSAVKSQDCHSLHQTRSLIHELKNKEIHFQRWQTTYALTLEAGEKLLNTANLETKESVNKRISQLQDNWKDRKLQLGEMIKQFQSAAETWDQCEKKIKELKNRLHVLKAQSKEPLPELHEELHREKELIKELEKSLANWTQNLKELHTMKTDLAQHILVDDVMVLKEQIEHLHRQWEDLCLRVAIRKQEIEDRLNSWMVFNEKNKELCAWLVQMENKVLQTADISIEEMIEKLQKDCMEEINLFSENKLQLKQMGDRLIKASNKTRAAEIDDKLNKINDRWQHLFDVIGS
ncbi:SYNE2, partial [Cervus elaphus hippelaphus]